MDAFYASVELLRYPQLKGLPVVIGGGRRKIDEDLMLGDTSRALHDIPVSEFPLLRDYTGRGVITTATYAARQFGVGSAMGLMKAAKLCPQAVLLPVDFAQYRHYSQRFKSIITDIAPLMENRGVDEVYIDFTDVPGGQREAGRVLARLGAMRLPTLAAVNGHSIGGGFELALACDLRIASTNARFAGAGVNVGLMASTYRLPRLIGVARAKALLLTGLPSDAVQAEQWGLVTALHPPEDLAGAALDLAARIASRAPLSVEASKRTIDAAMHLSSAQADELAATELAILTRSQDHREALVAFREKREPKFTRS